MRASRARCCAGPDHRDTYDAMFDLYFPAALGARTVLDDEESDDDGLPPEDVEAMRQMLLDMLPTTMSWPTWTSGWRR